MTGKRRRNVSESEENSSVDDDCIMELDGSCNSRSKGGNGSNTSSGSPDGTAPRKRGRGPSKRPCLNRNALMARVNRQRKKEYLEKIENKLSYYRRENKNLSTVIQQQGIDLKRLTAEVAYLRNVLNNNSSITALLKTMNEALKKGKVKNEEDKWDSEKMADIEMKRGPELKLNPPNKGNAMSFKIASKALLSFVESDHSYSSGFVTDDLFDFEDISCETIERGNFNLPQDNINGNDVTQLGIEDNDIDQLDGFDTDIFDLPTNSDGSDGIDLFRSNQNQADNLFENLDNSGICLHVNSGRVSLEFCSICHLNSINSDDP